MHIPDGFLSGEVNLATYAVSAVVCGLAVSRANRNLKDHQVPLLGTTAAFVFAAQILNFPIGGGTSGHFLGAVLAAVLLGPLSACLLMALVLTIQCLVFADGGLTALGTNVFNMGVVGGIGSYYLYAGLKALAPPSREGFLAASCVAAWFSVVAASAACALELAFSGTSPLEVALPAMVGVHAVIGVGEAIITATVLSLILARRADLVSTWKVPPAIRQAAGEWE